MLIAWQKRTRLVRKHSAVFRVSLLTSRTPTVNSATVTTEQLLRPTADVASPTSTAPRSVRNELRRKQDEQRQAKRSPDRVRSRSTRPDHRISSDEDASVQPARHARPARQLPRRQPDTDSLEERRALPTQSSGVVSSPYTMSHGRPPSFPGSPPHLYNARAQTVDRARAEPTRPNTVPAPTSERLPSLRMPLNTRRPSFSSDDDMPRAHARPDVPSPSRPREETDRTNRPRRAASQTGYATGLSDADVGHGGQDASHSSSDSSLSSPVSAPPTRTMASTKSPATSSRPQPALDHVELGAFDSDSSVDARRRERVASFSRSVPAFAPSSDDSDGDSAIEPPRSAGAAAFSRSSFGGGAGNNSRRAIARNGRDVDGGSDSSDGSDGSEDDIRRGATSRNKPRTVVSTLAGSGSRATTTGPERSHGYIGMPQHRQLQQQQQQQRSAPSVNEQNFEPLGMFGRDQRAGMRAVTGRGGQRETRW